MFGGMVDNPVAARLLAQPGLLENLWQFSPATFATRVSRGTWRPARHLAYLDKVVAGAVYRAKRTGQQQFVLVSMPPRHGKSEYCSVWLPTWFLHRWPQHTVGLASYTAQFSHKFSRRVRNEIATNPRISAELAPDSKNVAQWNTTKGGGMVAVGIGGPFTGHGFQLILIDDALKNWDEASSPTARQRVWDWWLSTARTRLQPGGVVVILMTRWHEDDLAGRIVKQMAENPHSDRFQIINLPAIATAEGDALGRGEGEALWAEMWSLELLEALRESVRDAWSPLYQGIPNSATGVGRIYHAFSRENVRNGMAWDPALPILVGCDFNVGRMCWTVAQARTQMQGIIWPRSEVLEELRVLREIVLPNSNTVRTCEALEELLTPWALAAGKLRVEFYGDASGNSRKTSAEVGDTDYTLVRRFFAEKARFDVGLHIPRANPGLRDSYNAMNALLESLSGTRRLFIDEHCVELRKDFEQVRWKVDASGNTLGEPNTDDNERTHISDSLRYLVAERFALNERSGGIAGVGWVR